MSLFIIPAILQPKDNEMIEVASKAGVEIASLISSPLHELYPYLISGKTVIVQLDPKHVALLSRHATELLPELPVMVMGTPGAVYSRDFEMFATSFMMEEWETFRRRLAKSGSLANTQEELEVRSNASTYSDSLATKDEPKSPSFKESFARELDSDSPADGSDVGV
jgi:hypothetical protein